MTKYRWANAENIGVLAMEPDGRLTYLDAGPEFETAVAEGPEPWQGPLDIVAPDFDPVAAIETERARMVVSRLQARAALLEAGLLDTVEKAVNGSVLSGSKVTPLVRLAWNEATEFRRSSPTIAAVGQLLGLAEDQLDELFRAAMRIEF